MRSLLHLPVATWYGLRNIGQPVALSCLLTSSALAHATSVKSVLERGATPPAKEQTGKAALALAIKPVNSHFIPRQQPTTVGSRVGADIKLAGKVVDEKGEGLPGVTVVVKGTTLGTTTGPDGSFSLQAPENSTLVFSYIGYARKEVAANKAGADLLVALAPDSKGLDEIVVVGYGTARKADVTGAVATISSKDFQNTVTTNVGQALQGRTAGVQVTQNTGRPGDAAVVRVRGVGTTGNSNPLYVIDGVISAKVLSQEMTQRRLTLYIDSVAGLGVFILHNRGVAYFEHGGADEGFVSQYTGSLAGGNGVIVMTNSDNTALLEEIINSVATTYRWKNYYVPITRTEVPQPTNVLAAYVGTYKLQDEYVAIALKKDGLWLTIDKTTAWRMYFSDATHFFVLEDAGNFGMLRDSTGEATAIGIDNNPIASRVK